MNLKELLRKARHKLLPTKETYSHVKIDLGRVFAERAALYRHFRGARPTSHDPKLAQKRRERRALRLHEAKCSLENPAGSKLLRHFAKNAGKLFGEETDLREGDYKELRDWYSELEEAPQRQGHQGFRVKEQVGSPLNAA